MLRDDPNREFLLVVAGALGDLCDEVVFVGESVAGLLLTDPVAEGIRATNPWYPEAVKTSTRVRLSDRVEVRVISGPTFVATKLEAFISRGGGDILSSHDLEDILTVVDGRPLHCRRTERGLGCASEFRSRAFQDPALAASFRELSAGTAYG
jgi:hypothetical protein